MKYEKKKRSGGEGKYQNHLDRSIKEKKKRNEKPTSNRAILTFSASLVSTVATRSCQTTVKKRAMWERA